MTRFQLRMNFILLLLAATAMAQTKAAPAVDDTTLANHAVEKAEKFYKAAQYDSSYFYYEKAAAFYEKPAARLRVPRLWEKYIACCNLLGDIARRKNDPNNAKAYLNKALDLGRTKLGEKHREVAQTYHFLGTVYIDEPDKGLAFFDKALAIRLLLFGENHVEVGKTYNNLGVLYKARGDYDNAVKFFNKSAAVKIKTSRENSIELARTYNNLADLYRLMGDLDQALNYQNQSFELKQKILGDDHPEVGGGYINTGNVHLERGDFLLALENYQKAFAFSQRRFGESSPEAAFIASNVGFAYNQLGEDEQALAYFTRALNILLKTRGANDSETARVYYYLGELYLKKQSYDKARENLKQALAIRIQTLGERTPLVSQTYRELARLFLRQAAFAEAIAYVHKAILSVTPDFKDTNVYANPPLKNLGSKTDLLPALTLKAQAFEELFAVQPHNRKNMRMALSTHQLAAELVDEMRRDYRTEESKLFLGKRSFDAYESGIHAAFTAYQATRDNSYRDLAFRFAEKSKAAALAQALQESRAKQFSGIPLDLIEKERNLKIDLTFYETEIEKEKQKNEKQDKLKLRQYQDRYFALKRDYEKLSAHLEKSYPQYYALKYKIATASISDLQKSLDNQTAVLEYFLGDSAITTFVVTKQGLEVVAIKRDPAFAAMVTDLANSFKNVTSKSAYLQRAVQLYQILVKPLEAYISNKPQWIIIPGGELHQIPFEALLTAVGTPQNGPDYRALPYLINQHEISYHYSATLFLKSLQESPTGGYTNLFAGFAPVFDAAAKNGVIYREDSEDSSAVSLVRQADSTFLATRDGKTLEPLLYSAQEVQDILATFPDRSRAFLQQEASEENFKQQIKGYKYVHLATDGRLVETNPKLSNLTFSQPQNSKVKEDGILYSAETYNLDLNADLLVLSACQTGAGQIVKGEGLMGLTRGFLYSGARNIVASLWKVYDRHTSLLMVEMYRQIAAGKSYSAALREAKLKMIANAETAAPQSWAGFVLIGK